MDSNLMIYDIDHFLNKYTRFMTKNIYISNKTYQRFLNQYQYLYQILEKDRFLYSDNIKYKKMMNIMKNARQLMKLHNQKYLQKTSKEYQGFFDSVSSKEPFDSRKKSIILCEEENILVIQPKNIESLVTGKIQYLLQKKQYPQDKIIVLTETTKDTKSLKEEIKKQNINISIQTIKDYGYSLLNDNELLDNDQKYLILLDYLQNKLFPKKELFTKFYEAFSKYIYLNKDYKDYETFKDYHNYMYKRKYLASNLSLKKFNEQEIKKKRTYLRTIQNEIMPTKEEVDIANFLYLNSINYQYEQEKSIFLIQLGEKQNEIKYHSYKEPLEIKKNTLVDLTINLYSSYIEKKSCLQVLAYELIKRRYPLELISDNDLYHQLKETTTENYFSEFIRKHLIPIIDYYEEHQNLKNTKLTTTQQNEIMNIYKNYQATLKEYHYLKEKDIFYRVEKDIVNQNNKYLILIGNIPVHTTIPTMTIIPDYQDVDLLKENIKLLYDYKKYLYENQTLPIPHVYLGKEELSSLTSTFLKENLTILNEALEENKKIIEVTYYEDQNRLHIYRNISNCCNNLLEYGTKNTLLAFTNIKDINILVNDNYFFKLDKNTLQTKQKESIPCEEILKISKLYNTIILPYLITDNYHENLLNTSEHYHIKVMLYVALSKCRQNLILLCPKSRKQELQSLLKNIKNTVISE